MAPTASSPIASTLPMLILLNWICISNGFLILNEHLHPILILTFRGTTVMRFMITFSQNMDAIMFVCSAHMLRIRNVLSCANSRKFLVCLKVKLTPLLKILTKIKTVTTLSNWFFVMLIEWWNYQPTFPSMRAVCSLQKSPFMHTPLQSSHQKDIQYHILKCTVQKISAFSNLIFSVSVDLDI